MRLLAVFMSVVVVACGGAGTANPEDTTTTTRAAELPEGLSTTTYEGLIADAANRARVDESEVELVSIEQDDFSDTALGCPEEGRFYAQIITPGFRVLVSAGGTEYDYRVAEDDEEFRLCESPVDPSG